MELLKQSMVYCKSAAPIYQAPDQCNCFEPQSCCERLAAGDNAVKPTGCPTTGTSGGVAVVPRGVYAVIATLATYAAALDAETY